MWFLMANFLGFVSSMWNGFFFEPFEDKNVYERIDYVRSVMLLAYEHIAAFYSP